MKSIELSAGTIDYLDTGGDGPPLVFIHGLVMNDSLWHQVIAGLQSDHRCIAPVLPLGGHRTPMRADADLSLHGQARLLAEFIERLDLHDVTLVSNDWGGPQITAVEHPERLASLVLLPQEAFDNIPPGLPGKFAGLIGRMPGGFAVAAQTLRVPLLRRLPITFGWMAKRPIPRDVLASWIEGPRHQRGVRRDIVAYIKTSDNDGLTNAATQFERFDKPVLVLWCTDNRVMPRDHGPRLAKLFPNARLVEVDDSCTLMPLDAPDRVMSEIRQFVAEQSAPADRATSTG
jgi:pimeloyl-ACP methyl ester carboxylesterase